jgi:hypothetical protein
MTISNCLCPILGYVHVKYLQVNKLTASVNCMQ